jgi:hypothetical protein
MRKRTEKIECEVALTDRELLDYGQKLAQTTREVERERLHQKEVVARANALIKSGEMLASEYINKIERKCERRFVQCAIEYDWETHVKRWIRCDNGICEKEDIIEEHELQEEADLQAADQQRPEFPLSTTGDAAAGTIGEAVDEKVKAKKTRGRKKVGSDMEGDEAVGSAADAPETRDVPATDDTQAVDPDNDISVGEARG